MIDAKEVWVDTYAIDTKAFARECGVQNSEVDALWSHCCAAAEGVWQLRVAESGWDGRMRAGDYREVIWCRCWLSCQRFRMRKDVLE